MFNWTFYNTFFTHNSQEYYETFNMLSYNINLLRNIINYMNLVIYTKYSAEKNNNYFHYFPNITLVILYFIKKTLNETKYVVLSNELILEGIIFCEL